MTDRSTNIGPTDGPSTAVVEELCREHLPLVHYEVRTIAARLPGHVFADDLISAGMAALVTAARSFDPTLGVPFGRYAVRRVRGALLDELRSADWATRSLRAKVRKRDAVQEELTAELGRVPTRAELAATMGLPAEELQRLDIDLHTSLVLRLDVIADAVGADAFLPATTETPEATLVLRERLAYLRDAVDSLPERLGQVVRGSFFEERSMRELADELGVSESRVSQMRSEALLLLREGLNSQLDPAMLSPAAGQGGAGARRKAAFFAQVAARSTYRQRLTAVAETGAGTRATAGIVRTA